MKKIDDAVDYAFSKLNASEVVLKQFGEGIQVVLPLNVNALYLSVMIDKFSKVLGEDYIYSLGLGLEDEMLFTASVKKYGAE